MATRRERKGLGRGVLVYTDNKFPTPLNMMDPFCNIWREKKIGKFKVLCGGVAVVPNLWHKSLVAHISILITSVAQMAFLHPEFD